MFETDKMIVHSPGSCVSGYPVRLILLCVPKCHKIIFEILNIRFNPFYFIKELLLFATNC